MKIFDLDEMSGRSCYQIKGMDLPNFCRRHNRVHDSFDRDLLWAENDLNQRLRSVEMIINGMGQRINELEKELKVIKQ